MSSITLSLALRGRLLSGTQTTFQGALFGNNEPGVIFDPTDITTLYQDRAGTTPVTAAGQSVGLRLDKSKGLALGAERGAALTLPGWTVTSGVTVSEGVAAFSSAAQNSNAYNVVGTVEVGKTYRVNLTVSSYVSGTAALLLPGGSGRGAITSNGTFTGIYTASSTGVIYLWAQGASNNTFVISDYSVRELAGNHEVAINDAARGIYGWMPKTGRRNLLTYTEQFDIGTWTKVGATVSADVVAAPDGLMVADKIIPNAGTSGYVAQFSSIITATAYTFSVYAKLAEHRYLQLNGDATSSRIPASAYFDLQNGTVRSNLGGIADISSVGDGWFRCSVSATSTSTGAQPFLRTSTNGTTPATGDGTSGVYIWGAQLEPGSTATAYQRVVSNYDITEAGVPSCYYVLANGVNTAYSTPTITPGTDKVQVFAGVRKNSDAATGMIAELSAVSSNAGTFALYNNAAASNTWRSRGTVAADVTGASGASPVSLIFAGLGDISGDRSTLRINGTQVAQSTSDQGTGNYLAYPAYIYARGGTSFPFNGYDFGHAVRFGPNLDAATIARVEALIARNTPEVTI